MSLWKIFIILLLIYILNSVALFFYCRIMVIYEKKKIDRKKKWYTSIMILLFEHYLYGWMRFCVIRTGFIPSNKVRNILYRVIFNAHITSKTVINGGCEIRSPWNLYASNCIIMNNCILDARSKIIIKDNVVFGQGVHIWTEEHDVDSPTFAVLEKNKGAVIINERAWICSDSTILPKVIVGEGAVLASRAVATKDLIPFGIYAGIPAILKRFRNQELMYNLSGKPHWHFY